MATKPKALTAAQIKERKELAYGFAVAIAGSTVIFEVLDQADGKFTTQVNRVAFEIDGARMTAAEYLEAKNGRLKLDVPRVVGEHKVEMRGTVPESWGLL